MRRSPTLSALIAASLGLACANTGIAAAPARPEKPLAAAPPKAPAATPEPAGGAGANADKSAKRRARLIKALMKRGLSEEKSKRVASLLEKSRTELREIRKQIRSARQELHEDETNAAAKQRLQDSRQKRYALRARTNADLAEFLTPAEHAKVRKLLRRAAHNRRRAERRAAAGMAF